LGFLSEQDQVLVEVVSGKKLWKEWFQLVVHPWDILQPVGCVPVGSHDNVY
jgi:hypothetical protein